MAQIGATDSFANPTGNRPSWLRRSLHRVGLSLSIASLCLIPASKVAALEEVRLSYAGFHFGAISVSDLENFVATKQPSQNLSAFLELIKVDPDTAIQLLTTQVIVNGQLLDEASQTFVGESFFQLVGTAIKLPNASTPSWPLLRDAVVTAATDDQINALEVLQAFESEAVIVDTEKVGQVIEQIQKDGATLQAFFESGFGSANQVSDEP
jgi:hypothetical protein